MNSDIVFRDTFGDDFLELKKELVENLEKYFDCDIDCRWYFDGISIRLKKVPVAMALSSRQIEVLYHTNIQKHYRVNRDYAKKETIEEIIKQVENRFTEEFKKMIRRDNNDI